MQSELSTLKSVQSKIHHLSIQSEEKEEANRNVESFEFHSYEYAGNGTSWSPDSTSFKKIQVDRSKLAVSLPAHLKAVQEESSESVATKLCSLFGLALLNLLLIALFTFNGKFLLLRLWLTICSGSFPVCE